MEEGRPATTSPYAGSATHGQAAARASLQGKSTPLAGAAACRGGSCENTYLQRDACKGGRLQGARKGLPPVASPVANRGSNVGRRGGRLFAGWLPACKGSRWLRSSGDDDDAYGARGVRVSF
ncbi:hypothetical protein GW17_00059855 [Ensete ventricosum]|nr:hypothetical protein GW17_00059855 [Ensete ventricosum]